MVGWYEVVGEQNDPGEVGKIRLNTSYETRKKPVWLVLVKLLGLAVFVAVGYGIMLPVIPLPLWQACVAISGVILIYIGLAFFLRPEPNEDNMGFVGGLFNDPTRYSDNLNRSLWNLHCCLGPGRFAVEAILDLCTLLGLTAERTTEEAEEEQMAGQQAAEAAQVGRWRSEALERVEQRRSERPGGEVPLSSARFMNPDRFED